MAKSVWTTVQKCGSVDRAPQLARCRGRSPDRSLPPRTTGAILERSAATASPPIRPGRYRRCPRPPLPRRGAPRRLPQQHQRTGPATTDLLVGGFVHTSHEPIQASSMTPAGTLTSPSSKAATPSTSSSAASTHRILAAFATRLQPTPDVDPTGGVTGEPFGCHNDEVKLYARQRCVVIPFWLRRPAPPFRFPLGGSTSTAAPLCPTASSAGGMTGPRPAA
jgi:hypothetical protein